MARIVKLEIKNYRGIKDLELKFKSEQNLICLIGRGDSGKSTILEAIAVALSPRWDEKFFDTDFYNCDINEPIDIQVMLIDFPEKELLSEDKFFSHVCWYDEAEQKSQLDITKVNSVSKPALIINLRVDSSLEPKWTVTNPRPHSEGKKINHSDRALFNCFRIADYLDSHFSWNRGGPLYSLLRSQDQTDEEAKKVIIDAIRITKSEIDKQEFDVLKDASDSLSKEMRSISLAVNPTTSVDFKDLATGNKLVLHEKKIFVKHEKKIFVKVPFRLLGKGSKRLASIAVQTIKKDLPSLLLIDEIEQGLEPDRICYLVNSLKENESNQTFITTHSRDVIVELGCKPLVLLLKKMEKINDHFEYKIVKHDLFVKDNDDLLKAVRACPEAFFARKVIVCEGKTEVGICRALDKWRVKNDKDQMALKDCAYVDGQGSNFISRVEEIANCGITTCLFCDADEEEMNKKIKELRKKYCEENSSKKITAFQWGDGKSIEDQVFADLPEIVLKKLVDLVELEFDQNNIKAQIRSKYVCNDKDKLPENWEESNVLATKKMREALGAAAKSGEWFKRIDHGEQLGVFIFDHFGDLYENSHLKKTLLALSDWIDE